MAGPDVDRRGDIAAIVADSARLAADLGREDLSKRLRAAGARARRPTTVVCVVGEFKQGKSSLVNALVDEAVCPVDDDLATSVITMLSYGEQRAAVAHRGGEGGRQSARVPFERVAQIVSEAGNPDNRMAVDRVDVTLPSPLLQTGISLIDTPGVGGLGGAQKATLAFLPLADALLFVTDASAELAAPELKFLRQAVDACPAVVVALSKIDLYPEWRRIAELDRGHLARHGIDVPLVAVSSHLRLRAVRTGDEPLNQDSGLPELGRLLQGSVLDPARTAAGHRSLLEAGTALEQLAASQRTEDELADPAQAAEAIASLEQAKAELEHLRGPAARWTLLLGDRLANLGAEVGHDLRGAMREASRVVDERAEEITTAAQAEALATEVQGTIADAVGQVQERLRQGLVDTQQAVIDLLRDEAPSLPGLAGVAPDGDVTRFWSDLDHDPTHFVVARKVASGANQVADALRGASGGLMVLSTVQRVLPVISTTLLMSTPFTIGLGVWFGGRSVLDARKRRIAMHRQEARGAVRKAIDDVTFEVGDQITTALRLSQQQLRDLFTERFAELQRSTQALLQEAQETAKRTDAEQRQRATERAATRERIDQLLARVSAAASATSAQAVR